MSEKSFMQRTPKFCGLTDVLHMFYGAERLNQPTDWPTNQSISQ